VTPEAADDGVPPGGDPIGDVRWEPWSPDEVAARLRSVDDLWAFAAGWALDLFRGRPYREHQDIEIAVPAAHFDAIRAALAPYEFEIVGAGRRWPLSDDRAMAATHQTWLRDPTGAYKLDVFREPHDGNTWICRRDTSIRLPYKALIRRTADGLPYIAPEVALLFKARHMRDKDERDLDGVLPLLDIESRAWLVEALGRVHPGHPWIAKISA
jgi:hypothetical protein